jgi:hypothetical protein
MRTHIYNATGLTSCRRFTQRGLRFGYQAERRNDVHLRQLMPYVRRRRCQISMGDNATDACVIYKDVQSTPYGNRPTNGPYSVHVICHIRLHISCRSKFLR